MPLATAYSIAYTFDWKVDKGIPYPYGGIINNPGVDRAAGDPTLGVNLGVNALYRDSPGTLLYPAGGMYLRNLKQDFEFHVVCLSGRDAGTTYGGFRWGHSFNLKTTETMHTIIGYESYNYTQYAVPMGPPSQTWINVVWAHMLITNAF